MGALPEPIELRGVLYGFGSAMLPYRAKQGPAQISRNWIRRANPFVCCRFSCRRKDREQNLSWKKSVPTPRHQGQCRRDSGSRQRL